MEFLKTADHQACAHQQDERKSDLRHHQNAARALAAGIRIGAPQPLFQRLVHVGPSQAQSRKNSRQDSADYRNDGGEGENLRIQPDFHRMGKLVRQEGHDQTDSSVSEGQAEGSSREREQYRLGENLPQQREPNWRPAQFESQSPSGG